MSEHDVESGLSAVTLALREKQVEQLEAASIEFGVSVDKIARSIFANGIGFELKSRRGAIRGPKPEPKRKETEVHKTMRRYLRTLASEAVGTLASFVDNPTDPEPFQDGWVNDAIDRLVKINAVMNVSGLLNAQPDDSE